MTQLPSLVGKLDDGDIIDVALRLQAQLSKQTALD
jgi:hypothetical protein